MNYLIGYFSRRQVFHIVEYSDTQEEVDEFLKTHNRRGLIVYTAQQSVQADGCERHAANESLGFKFCPDCGNPYTRH